MLTKWSEETAETQIRDLILTLLSCPTEKVTLPLYLAYDLKLRRSLHLSFSWWHLTVSLLCWGHLDVALSLRPAGEVVPPPCLAGHAALRPMPS